MLQQMDLLLHTDIVLVLLLCCVISTRLCVDTAVQVIKMCVICACDAKK